MAESSGYGSMTAACAVISIDTDKSCIYQMPLKIIHGGDADKNSSGRTGQIFGDDPSIFQALPGDFQNQTMLRIHAFGFLGSYAEKLGIKSIHTFQKSTVPGVDPIRDIRVRVVPYIGVPAKRRGLDNGVFFLSQQFPEQLRRMSAARESASHANNGNRAVKLVPFAANRV